MHKYRWDNSSRIDGINNMTYAILFRDYYLKDDSSGNLDIYKTIINFTLAPIKNSIIKSNGFSLIKKKKDNGYEYSDGRINIDFDVISNYVKDRKQKKELTSPYRYGKCHERSLELAYSSEKAKVITGYVNFNGMHYLHSVVELELDGQVCILDWTKNLIINKKDYIILTGFNKISSISSKDIMKDSDLLNIFDISLKTYTLFRDEIVSDLEKNVLIKRRV